MAGCSARLRKRLGGYSLIKFNFYFSIEASEVSFEPSEIFVKLKWFLFLNWATKLPRMRVVAPAPSDFYVLLLQFFLEGVLERCFGAF